ncbi:hypothetical protein G8C92_12535 [Paenibacillus donghaensis]|nr:hypothetical protein [Paenibacillus donghaensis]
MLDDELLVRQKALQAEAGEVAEELKLMDLLSRAGEPVRVGSSALGLMVWRDLDITVICPRLDKRVAAQIASELMLHAGVRELKFINDTGMWNTDPTYPDGLYLGLKYKSLQGKEWKLDIWFVDEPDRQPDLGHLKTMPEQLTPQRRESILRIKSIWAERAEYGKTVRSYDIYTAVLNDDVRTLDQFQEWLEHRPANNES